MTLRCAWITICLLPLLHVACARSDGPSATAIDPATTQPSYWYDQPAAAHASGTNFEQLWAACEDVSRERGFRLDRSDFRSGLITTRPLVSAQIFEPWRGDVVTLDDSVESSLATIRRIVRFEFARLEGGDFTATPKVLVERQALAEQRVTTAISYRQVFARPLQPDLRQRGTPESDVGIRLPDRYWYPIGRDQALEAVLVTDVEKKLRPRR